MIKAVFEKGQTCHYFAGNSITMKFVISVFVCLFTLLNSVTVLGQKKPFDIEHDTVKNCVSRNKIHSENIYNNRRQIMTTCSKEDFMTLPIRYNLTCTQILVDHFFCDICFDEKENSLISYDGTKFYFENILPSEITNECLALISNMRMGSLEHSEFLDLHNR